MAKGPTFRQFLKEDIQACLGIFDANCPEYFSPNERDDYLDFLDACPASYEVYVDSGRVLGA